MIGIKTINQDTTPSPILHNIFNTNVKMTITINLKKAVLFIPLNISIIIWDNENPKYSIAGGHKDANILYIISEYYFLLFYGLS